MRTAILSLLQRCYRLSLLFLGGVAATASAVAEEQKISLVTGSDYAPYTSSDLPEGGVVSEVVKRVFEAQGYETSLTFYPWKRAYNRVLSVKSDATFPYAWSEERAADFLYSRPINVVNTRVFQSAGKPFDFDGVEDLSGMVYCQPLGYRTEPELSEMIEQGRLFREEGKDMDACFMALKKGRVDFVVSNDLVAWEAAKRVAGADAEALFAAAAHPFRSITEHVIVSRQHPRGAALIEAFNRHYDRLLAEGVIQEIWRARLGLNALPAM